MQIIPGPLAKLSSERLEILADSRLAIKVARKDIKVQMGNPKSHAFSLRHSAAEYRCGKTSREASESINISPRVR